MIPIKILVWAINKSKPLMESACAPLLKTANIHHISVELFGIGHEFIEHKQRIWILRDYLKTIPENTIVLCMDGSDTLFNNTASVLLKKFKKKKTNILISAEKAYSYQYHQFIDRFNQISSDYRYVNAGTFIGYAGALLQMLNEIILINQDYPSANDQGLLGIWVSKHIDTPNLVKLDTNCAIFWVTTGDWLTLKKVANSKKIISNPYTNTVPVIIHSVGNGDPQHRACYDVAYRNIMTEE